MNKEILEEFYKAWRFLKNHPMFSPSRWDERFLENLYPIVVKVNPETDSVDDDEEKNTKVQIWLEAGPVYINKTIKGCSAKYSTQHVHDLDLDCGADTYEEAIIELARLVKERYGDYNEGNTEDYNRIRESIDLEWQ